MKLFLRLYEKSVEKEVKTHTSSEETWLESGASSQFWKLESTEKRDIFNWTISDAEEKLLCAAPLAASQKEELRCGVSANVQLFLCIQSNKRGVKRWRCTNFKQRSVTESSESRISEGNRNRWAWREASLRFQDLFITVWCKTGELQLESRCGMNRFTQTLPATSY